MKLRRRVSKAEWFEQALQVLSKEGVQGIRIDRLARDIGTSRSGFYWHFEDRQDLLDNLLDYWSSEFTLPFLESRALQSAEPLERLQQVMTVVRDLDLAKYEVAMLAWAEHDSSAQMAHQKVMQLRMKFVRQAFEDLGFDDDDAEIRARMFISYVAWGKAPLGYRDSAERSDRLLSEQLAILARSP